MKNSQQIFGWRLSFGEEPRFGFILGALLLLCAFFAFSSSPASALTTVPTKMNFQGRLTDSAGNIKPNGTYNMKLRLYTVNSGGAAVWTEDRLVSAGQGVTVTNGLFSIQLGSVTTLPASLFASGELYLEVELPTPATATSSSPSWTEGAMTPRNQMATSAYAYNAETLDGLDSAAFGQLGATQHWSGYNYFDSGAEVDGAFFAVFTDEIYFNVGASDFNVHGDSIFKTPTNSATAFSIQESAGTNLFTVDTSGHTVTLGTAGNFDTLSKLSNPATLPTGESFGTAWSPDGQYLSVAHSTSPYLTIYKRSGDTLTKLANPASLPTGQGNSTAWSPDGQYLSITHLFSPYVTVYKRSGDTFTKLNDPASLPAGGGYNTSWSPDGQYMSVGHVNSPYMSIYKRSGDTLTKLANPASLPPNTVLGTSWSPDGQYMSVATDISPYVITYKRSGDTFTKLNDPASLPAGSARGVAFSPDGTYLSVAHGTSPFVTIYKRSGDTFTKLSDPATLPAGYGYGTSWSPDGQYMSIFHLTSPYLTIYKRSGDTFTKLSDPATLPAGSGRGGAFSRDGQYLSVAHGTSPYVTVYKASGLKVTGDFRGSVKISDNLTANNLIITHNISANNITSNGLQVNGEGVFRSMTDSTTAFQIQNSAGAALLVADTVSSQISVVDVVPMTAATVGSNAITAVTTNTGQLSSVLGSDGFARIAHYDSPNGDLKFIQCTNADCTTSNSTVVDSTGTVGISNSIALGSDGFARIAYYDSTNGDLKFAQCANAACTTSNITTIDSTNNVGFYSSVSIGSDGFARIAYQANSLGDLKFAQCTNAACTTSNITTVDSTGSVGASTSIALGSDGFARIAYTDTTNSKLKFAQCTNAACTTSNLTVIADSTSGNSYNSIALGSDGFARISYHYYNAGNAQIRFVQCTNAACTTNNNNLAGANGYANSFALGSDGFARIAYSENTKSDLVFIQCTDSACTTKNTNAIDTYGYKGNYASVSIGSDGFARIAYAGSTPASTTNDIYFARLTSSSGAEIRSGVSLGSSGSNAFAEVYTKKLDVEGGVTIDATTHNAFGAAVTIIGSDSYIEARPASGSASFSVTKDSFTFNDASGRSSFGTGINGFNISNNTGSANAATIYQAGTGTGLAVTVMPSASSALLLSNDDTGNQMLNISAEGKTTFIAEAVDTKAFSFGTFSGSLFAIDTSNSRVQIGEATADATGVVLVLDTKNTAGDPTGVDGAMYYNSSSKSFRCYQNGAWRSCIGGLVASNSSIPGGNTITSATSNGSEVSFSSNYAIPAGDCQPGKVYRVTARGQYTTSAVTSPTLTLAVKLGSTTLGTTGTATSTGMNGRLWVIDFNITCFTIGASGTVEGSGIHRRFTGPTNTADHEMNTGTTTLNNSGAMTLQIGATWSSNAAGNSVTLRQFMVESLAP